MTRVAVVTGASAGIGREAAKMLAAAGWRVIALGRDPVRSADAAAEIRAAAPAGDSAMIVADLASLADAERAAAKIAAITDRVDVLINNAGGVAAERRITAEGNEATFAGNHLGPFLLTDRLLPLLRAAAADSPPRSVRIVVTSSTGHFNAPGFDWGDPQMMEGFQSGRAYCNAKLANLLFARALARRLEADGIVVQAMHPGVVDSNFVSHADKGMQDYMSTLDLRPPYEAGEMLFWLATADAPGQTSGGYFHGRGEVPSSDASQDPALADRLWQESARILAAAGHAVH